MKVVQKHREVSQIPEMAAATFSVLEVDRQAAVAAYSKTRALEQSLPGIGIINTAVFVY